MDKGLIKIAELKEYLKQLQSSKLKNDLELDKLIEEETNLEFEIENKEFNQSQIKDEKKDENSMPKNARDAKKALLISLLLAYLAISLIATLAISVGSGLSISVLKCLGASFVMSTFISLIVIPVEFKNIKKKYSNDKLENIDTEKEISDSELDSLKNKKALNKNQIEKLKLIKSNLEAEIKAVFDQINCIENIREKAISEFLRDNPILDKKLDEAYELEVELKGKEKIK